MLSFWLFKQLQELLTFCCCCLQFTVKYIKKKSSSLHKQHIPVSIHEAHGDLDLMIITLTTEGDHEYGYESYCINKNNLEPHDPSPPHSLPHTLYPSPYSKIIRHTPPTILHRSASGCQRVLYILLMYNYDLLSREVLNWYCI